ARLEPGLTRVELAGACLGLADAGRRLRVGLLVPAAEARARRRVAELPLASVELPLARGDRRRSLGQLVRLCVRDGRTVIVLAAARGVDLFTALELALTLGELPLARRDRRCARRELAGLDV